MCGVCDAENAVIDIRAQKKADLPVWYHESLYHDGKNIWVANGLKGKTWVVDPDTGNVLKEVQPPGTFTESVTISDDGAYVVTDWDLMKIFTARAQNGSMIIDRSASLEPAHPAGAVSVDGTIYLITWTRSLLGTRFHLVVMDDKLNIVKTQKLSGIQEPCQLTHDGKNLWISCWYDDRVYKVDAVTFEVLGYFKSPVKKTTGVAWDGKYFWVTGTYADLYRVELLN
jgi:DNA-binding beta-propeller fold protein YncE